MQTLNLSDREFLVNRLGFLDGVIEGIRLYAIWKDGEQLVGCMQQPLREVLKRFEEQRADILTKLGPPVSLQV